MSTMANISIFSKLNVSDFLNVDCLLSDEEALELNDDKVIKQRNST